MKRYQTTRAGWPSGSYQEFSAPDDAAAIEETRSMGPGRVLTLSEVTLTGAGELHRPVPIPEPAYSRTIETVSDLIDALAAEDPDRPVRIQTRAGKERRSIQSVHDDPADLRRVLITGY